MKLLWKVLRGQLSAAQIIGFALSGVVGMTVVLGAFQAFRDVAPILGQPDSFLRGDYLVLSKRVHALRTLGLGSSDFTSEEIAELEAQPFVREVGALTPADYRITGRVGLGGAEISTYLFFESVPDRFIDVGGAQWRYEAGSRDIPIIIPRNYVNLYNYGFAPAQGLPQISEGLLRRMSLGIDIAGNGREEHFRGRIVGLSNRLNTILVPEAFIRWSNERFGTGAKKRPARVIVETDRPADASLPEFLARKGYEAEGDRRDEGKAARLLRLAAVGAAGVGLVLSLLSCYILLLSIFLLLQKNSDKIENLLLLGYTAKRAALPYQLLMLGLNAGVLVAALAAAGLLRLCYLPSLAGMQEGYHPAGFGLTLLSGVGLALALSLLGGLAIRRRIGRLGP